LDQIRAQEKVAHSVRIRFTCSHRIIEMIKNCLKQLWQDEAGFVMSSELVLIATIMVIGIIAGQTAVRDAVVGELADVAAAIGDVNQSYSFGAVTGHCSSTSGSIFMDQGDFCEIQGGNNDTTAIVAQCINICSPATPE
jgi:Flp pilus assembly pilin Flp